MENPQEENRVKKANNAIKYSGIGFQMVAIIGVFAFIGYKIDASRPGGGKLFTAIFALIGVCCSLYLVIRQVMNSK